MAYTNSRVYFLANIPYLMLGNHPSYIISLDEIWISYTIKEICRKLSTHFIHLHKTLPYPLPDMCRKHEEMTCFGK